MRVEWQPRALKDMRKLDARTRERIITAVDRFAETGQGDVRKLVDVDPPEYRLRVGDWRVRFALDTTTELLSVLRVLPRGKAY